MTIDEIKELIRVVQETGIAELEVRRGDDTVRIKRASSPSSQEVMMPAVLPVAVSSPVPTAPSAALLPPSQEPAPTVPDLKASENDVIVKSPIVGTYYDAPAPGMPPFVKIGDRVEPKQ